MNEQLINDRIRLDNINSEMSRISNVAREYMNASQEQRDRVDPQLLASVLDRYNMLKADKLALEQSVVAREMEAQRATMQQPQQQTYNGWGRRRTIVPRNNPDVNVPNPDVVVDNPSLPNDIVIAYNKYWVPYYLDKTTWNQTAPTWYDANGNAVFANWQTLGNIQWDINWWINRYWENAQLARNEIDARKNAELERNKIIAMNMMSVPGAMVTAEAIAAWLAGWAGTLAWTTAQKEALKQALNNSYRGVQSNPLNYTRTLGTRNITRVPQWAINNTVNNAYRYVQSNPLDYNALRTIPSTLR